MNLVLDQAEEVNTKTGVKRPVGKTHVLQRPHEILLSQCNSFSILDKQLFLSSNNQEKFC
jgi:hypothetical protein